MVKVIGERGSGKTTKLMNAANKVGAVFVCADPDHMIEKAFSEGIKYLQFASYDDLLNGYLNGKKYVIDDLELFMNVLCGNMVGYSISDDSE